MLLWPLAVCFASANFYVIFIFFESFCFNSTYYCAILFVPLEHKSTHLQSKQPQYMQSQTEHRIQDFQKQRGCLKTLHINTWVGGIFN
jgi:hypothetical protein